MEVLQTSALPLGYGADRTVRGPHAEVLSGMGAIAAMRAKAGLPTVARRVSMRAKVGAGNGIRTRDFDLGKVALYH